MLVVAEVAIALPLVTSAALLSRSFVAQMEWRPGFERDHLLTFSMFLPTDAAKTPGDVAQTWDRLEKEIASLPGVKAVGTASAGPLFGGRETWEMQIEGRPANERASIRWFDMSPGFFSVLGVPIVRGRDFDATDVLDAPPSGLVNETLANRYWPSESPIGKHLVFVHGEEKATFTVKGVVRDVPPIRAGSSPEPELYWSNRQEPRAFTYFIVRTSVPPATVASAIRDRFNAVDRDFKIGQFTTMTQRVDAELRVPRFSMTLVIAFGLAALMLAGIGTYGLLAYFVEQRRRDIGIRLALGAQRTNVVRDVIRSGLALALPGIALGLVASMALSRAIRAFLSGVSPFDPVSVSISAGVVLVVAIAACAVPAWRASRVDPAVTLIAD
jgi:predicted permease